MIGRRSVWLMTLALLMLLASISSPAFPQDIPPTPAPGDEMVETVLDAPAELTTDPYFTYDPAGRRDPFVSLFDRVEVDARTKIPGVRGMMASELNLQGVIKDPDGSGVGMVIGNDNKGYFLRVGDEIYKATVIAVDIRKSSITFRQEVDDPRLIKPFRDVVLRLIPLEESADE
jgi:hypothetical protein